MNAAHANSVFLAISFLAFNALADGESNAEYFTLVGDDGVTYQVKRPGPNARRFPLFLSDSEEEVNWEEKDAAEKLVPLAEVPESKLSAELAKYGMRAFSCSFGGEVWSCIMYSPKGKARSLPMIVHIPGRGEIGEDVLRQFNQRRIFDIVLSDQFQRKWPCHLLAISPPESLGTFGGSVAGTPNRPQRRAELIVRKAAAMKGEYAPVDTNRLYITGFSFGGTGAIRVAMSYPGEFAAVVPIEALAPPSEFASEKHPGNYWYVCNEGDFVADGDLFAATKELQRRVNELGGDFRISVYPSVKGHNAWDAAWGEEAIWDWMFSKSLAGAVSSGNKPRTVPDKIEASINMGDAICSSSAPAVDEAHSESRPLDGLASTYFEPLEGFSRDDWWQVELKEPVAGRVRIETGDAYGKKILKSGYVELSGNGRTWRRAGGFSKDTGLCEFRAQSSFRFLRVRSNQGKSVFVIRQMQVFQHK